MSASESSSPILVAGFWRRLGAFLVDCLLLGIAGFGIGLLFKDALVHLGPWGRLLGFAIALVYFGLLSSSLTGGQTPGKRLLKIKVVDAGGNALTMPKAFMRFLPWGLPWFLNNAQFPESVLLSAWIYVLSLAIFGLGLLVLYLLIFNRGSRQSLHDLLVGSYVVQAESNGPAPATPLPLLHQVTCFSLLLIAIAAPYVAQSLMAREPFSSIAATYHAVSAEPWVTYAEVHKGTTHTTEANKASSTTHYMTITAYSNDPDISNVKHAERLANLALSADNNAASLDYIQVTLAHGYDIGISSSWESQAQTRTPSDWLAEKKTPPLP